MKINSFNNQYNLNRGAASRPGAQTSGLKQPSFKGAAAEKAVNPIVSGLSKLYQKAANTKLYQNISRKLSGVNSFKFLLIAESAYLASWYLICGLRDKKMDKDQKMQMAAHDVLTFGVSTAGALYLDDQWTSFVNKRSEKHFADNTEYYLQQGRNALKEDKNPPLKQLIDSASRTAGETGGKLKEGLEEAAGIIDAGLKGLIGKEGRLKTFQITKDKAEEIKSSITSAIAAAASDKNGKKGLIETITNTAGKYFDMAAARNQADSTMKGFDKIGKIFLVGLTYRYLGSVLASNWSVKLTEKFFPSKKTHAAKTESKTGAGPAKTAA